MTHVGDPLPAAPPEAVSLDALYRRYARWLGRTLRQKFRGVDAATSEDLVQETYARVVPYHARNVVRHPRALLLQVASNLARDHMRKSLQAGAAPVLIEEHSETEEHGSAPAQDEAVLMGQLIEKLPGKIRDVFVLSRFAGMSNQQIADRMNLSVKRVEALMTSALTLLAAQLAARD
ncbi:MAG: sigma-70 family RNA polymerase sigma factor [Caulobacter sp.]|nr:sigma-70 family RNA polymerase sigma factor [Caulobacter sp.]